MSIVSRSQVLAAIDRARQLLPNREAAHHAVAQSLCLPVEHIREVDSWCCPTGALDGVRLCYECVTTSAAYSAAMGPEPEDDGADSEGGDPDITRSTTCA